MKRNKYWYKENLTNYDRFLIGMIGLFGAALLYEPIYWTGLNLWCSFYGLIY
jgi:hypothetical protein